MRRALVAADNRTHVTLTNLSGNTGSGEQVLSWCYLLTGRGARRAVDIKLPGGPRRLDWPIVSFSNLV